MLLITIFFLDDTKTPLKGPLGVGSTPRRIVHRTCEFGGFNDVMAKIRKMVESQKEIAIFLRTFVYEQLQSVLLKRRKVAAYVRLGNLIGYALFPFTIALREDALDYVRSAKATGKRKKASLEALCTWHAFRLKLPCIFRNVPGPQEEITFYGHQALMIHVVSYAKKLNIILSVDEEIVLISSTL
ncbi:hypothetical protein NC653_041476 [Populus alba x Populus x berolinensis]|uniref:O-acyltransferase WSD1 C-terminal domain-containing protein n=1 Tax=Populus alba x Populus x berolinensis TaxID=444605 RepID=A0AAD6PQT4_9ROSI|nr:hypothetical protein NC653_041476 [Populus alba x Populus x berolinensis]